MFFSELTFGMTEDEITKELQKFGYKLQSTSEEDRENYGYWYINELYGSPSLRFYIDSERGMYYKTHFVRQKYNGEDIDEIMEQQIENFKYATNNDILVIPENSDSNFPNYRGVILNKPESDYWHNGNITVYIDENIFTVEFSYMWSR